jgi:acetyl esterase/lipase
MSHRPLSETDIPYGHAGGHPLLLDILRPAESSGDPLPVVIYIHGGGWHGGERTSTPNQLLAGAGFFTASISYRFSGEAPFPAQLHDVKAAIRWLRGNAEALGIDPDHIGLWGHSAGGHLSTLAALTANNPAFEGDSGSPGIGSGVQAVVPISAPTEFLIDWYAVDRRPVHEDGEFAILQLLVSVPVARQEVAKAASPLWHVQEGAPPHLLIHGDEDDVVPVGQARAHVAALRLAGNDAELIEIPGMDHGTIGPFLEGEADPLDLKQRVVDFFARHLRR